MVDVGGDLLDDPRPLIPRNLNTADCRDDLSYYLGMNTLAAPLRICLSVSIKVDKANYLNLALEFPERESQRACP